MEFTQLKVVHNETKLKTGKLKLFLGKKINNSLLRIAHAFGRRVFSE